MWHTITKSMLNTEIILPIMLALCLILLDTYYAQNYASIIDWCLWIIDQFAFDNREGKGKLNDC